MSSARPDTEFPADPYPGVAPAWSFVHLDAASHRLTADRDTRAGWRVAGATPTDAAPDLDRWLVERDAAPLADRVPVLAFGSNRCPSKLTWLREHLGLAGPVVVLRATVTGVAAVWASGWRARDGARPATLAVDPAASETHAVWMATPDQVAVLDRCEGRGERYDLARLHAGVVRTDDGAVVDDPWTYWPATGARAPLLVDGRPVRCADVDQDAARDLVGRPAPLPADGATPVAGAPDPRSWPDRVVVYGTLRPGGRAWPLLADHAVGTPRPATVRGRVYDTGRGYPALRVAAEEADRPPDPASGVVVTLRDPVAALPSLDAYEGPEYRRIRLLADVDGDRVVCWAWVWDRPVPGWPVVSGAWTN